MPGKYPTDPTLRAELNALRADQNTTNARLAEMLAIPGCTPTFLAKYLNDNLDRQVHDFEARAFDTLRAIRERIEFGTSIYPTSMVAKIGKCLDLIRKTGDIALITSPAGNGKTCAANHYFAHNPSAVRLNLNATTREANQIEALAFRTIDHRDWKGQTSRFQYLVPRFKGASRLLIVDNAQRLASSGRQWIFDFADEAECPVALIGNPETLDRIRTNDQQFSRIGIHATYELEAKELPAASFHVAQQHSDAETAEQISDLVSFIASQDGRLRAVRKTVVLAQELRAVSADLRDNPRKAVRAAHARLVRDYNLPSD